MRDTRKLRDVSQNRYVRELFLPESARGGSLTRRELIGAARDRQGGARSARRIFLPPPSLPLPHPGTWDIKTIMYDVGNFRTVGRADASYDALLKMCVGGRE